jgi:hemerythrin superfamily protein
LIHNLAVHSLAEEEVLYPEFKNTPGLGRRCRDHALSEHKTLKVTDPLGMDMA